MRTSNIFCRKVSPELACAIPEDQPVPAFITGALWEFAGKVGAMSRTTCRFNHDAAEASVRYNGFYLFQLLKPCHEHVVFNQGQMQSRSAEADPPCADPAAKSDVSNSPSGLSPAPELISA